MAYEILICLKCGHIYQDYNLNKIGNKCQMCSDGEYVRIETNIVSML